MILDGAHENEMFRAGFRIIAGIDEAGRGPLAGPVVAAAVMVKKGFEFSKTELSAIRDSKKLSPKKREQLHDSILASFPSVAIAEISPKIIDEINILQAAMLAMKNAIEGLDAVPEAIFIDGNRLIPGLDILQRAVVRGDEKILSVAAASIIAKVRRDRIMLGLHDKYPAYGFDKHKGYGTRLHLELLDKHGPCPLHRRSFRPVSRLLSES